MNYKTNYWVNLGLFTLGFILFISFKKISEFLSDIPLNFNLEIYLTIATINGTLFAIFFSIVLIAVQHSAQNYLPSILKRLKKDFRLIFVIIIAFASILLNILFYITNSYNLFVYSIMIFYVSFMSIVLYFYEIINFINPSVMVDDIRDKILSNMHKDMILLNKKTKKEVRGTILERLFGLAYQSKINSKDFYDSNIKLVEELFNHIEKSEIINDPETYKKSLENLSKIVDFYLLNKKLDSQQDAFIEHILIKLKLQADFLISKREHFKVIEVISTLEKISFSSLKNLKTLEIRGMNYITSLICYYIEQIGLESVQIKDLDLANECILSLKKIGMVSIDKNLNLNMIGERIKKLAIYSDEWFIYHKSISMINFLLIHLLDEMPKKENIKKIIPDYQVSYLIDSQRDILISSIKKYKNSLKISAVVSPLFGPLSEVRLNKIAEKILYLSQNPPVEMATANYENMSKKFIGELLKNSQQVIDIAKENSSSVILIDYAKEFIEILDSLIKTKLKTDRRGFSEEIESLKNLIMKCYNNDHTLNFLKMSIKHYLEKLKEDKKKNSNTIKQLNILLKKLEK